MYTLLTQSGTLVQFINLAVHSIHTELVPETFDLYYNVIIYRTRCTKSMTQLLLILKNKHETEAMIHQQPVQRSKC